MKYIYKYLSISFLLFISLSCSKTVELVQDPFVVAFEQKSLNLQNIENQEEIIIVYSDKAIEQGYVTIEVVDNIAVYDVDYTTTPKVEDGVITFNILKGETQKIVIFNKLNPNLAGDDLFVNFKIIKIEYSESNIQGNSELILNSSASVGGDSEPEVGGPNEGNQVYIDLSNQSSKSVQRDRWDLGFYCGDEFRVEINGSIFMAAKATTYADIDGVPESVLIDMQSDVAVSNGNVENANYVDGINGDITETAIDEISDNNNENKVYLINMGYKIGIYTPNIGSVDIQGDFRGWKKIRIIKNGEGYILQYANLEETTHQEIVITKDSLYNFIHFSFDTVKIVDVEPEKLKWDLCFTPFTYVILDPAYGSYIYSDFVIHNRKGGAISYQQFNTSELDYDNFKYANINESNFSKNQTTIGDNWRNVFNRSVYNDRFYILKDPNGIYYKIKFLAIVNADGVRGYPQFEYTILN